MVKQIGLRTAYSDLMPCKEIARELGISERAVKQALKRAFRKLRDGRARELRATAMYLREVRELREFPGVGD